MEFVEDSDLNAKLLIGSHFEGSEWGIFCLICLFASYLYTNSSNFYIRNTKRYVFLPVGTVQCGCKEKQSPTQIRNEMEVLK